MIDPRSADVRPPSTQVLFVDPAHFDVEYVINPHMEGMVGSVDRALAQAQWRAVKAAYEAIGYATHVVPPVPGLPDLCFVANQSLPVSRAGEPGVVVLSRMHAVQRRPEVAVLEVWYRERGWTVLGADCTTAFEAMGDVNWHPGRQLLYGGYGYRTQAEAYAERAARIGVPVVQLELVDPRFYHLDTCFSPLDEHTALIVPEAFTPDGLATLSRCFPRLLHCPLDEAVGFLACNGHCPDQRHFLADSGATKTLALVADAGFEVIALDTSEFRKSGGSVQCLKLMLD